MPKTILDEWRDMLIALEEAKPGFIREHEQLFNRIGHMVSMYTITQTRLASMLKDM
jgi:hypothetical protein